VRAGEQAVCLAALRLDTATGTLRGLAGDSAFEIGVALDGETLHLFGPDGPVALHWAGPLAHAGDDAHEGGGLSAPMPGKVVAVLVEAGAEVSRGQPVVVIEAMKMEHTIAAPADGKVTELRYRVGDQVAEGAALIGFEPA
jgi:3-methylcrotonyl-CoA carboxylase alpha subunit